MEEITKNFDWNSVNLNELLTTISKTDEEAGFSHGFDHKTRIITFSGNYLQIHLTKSGAIEKVVIMKSQLPKVRGILKAIDDTLVKNQETKYAQRIVYSGLKHTRKLRIDDKLTLYPLQEAVEYLSNNPILQPASGYPMVMQYSYTGSGDTTGWLDITRASSMEVMWRRMLSLLTLSFFSPSSNDMRWTTDIFDSYRHGIQTDGFVPKDFNGIINELSQTQHEDFVKVSATDYWSGYDLSTKSDSIPNDFYTNLDNIDNLSMFDKDSFDRAVSWFYDGMLALKISKGQAFVCFAFAIETLMDKKSLRCECCNQPKHQLSEKFSTFMKQYGGFADERQEQFIKQLYEIRSTHAHGLGRFIEDLDVWSADISQQGSLTTLAMARRTQIAILNWLEDRATKGP